ncbi:hypothetical protein ISF_07002 [Cordyceps fumosorosea ARSEF 2679]|uniref:ELYS-like domain-containing protein n=1 Tax=Cordyceps fumosorosea (strain ARSEF 2679) TaxID=1081104 RepID=A0A167QLZ6_CORFA|nr:hypothetical protein ISF_07002 [Cordyceps fumosorosea ARSEF 2679]OAA57761.1 hypothetical protein ISF_07002 [Cordyceps fumosorosea ARSEF 2679]
MLDYTQYQQVFPADLHMPYDRKLQQDIEAHRKTLSGVLFIDRVLRTLGIAKAKAYPPKTDSALKQLHQSVCDASMPTHHKLSLFYYILLDFDGPNGPPYISQDFITASGLPANYQIFMQGLWYMDQLEFASALEYVSHPSLGPDFSDEIIIALVQHAPNDDYTLPLAYYTSVRPVLKSSIAVELLFDAMARTNVTEALLYSRTFPDHAREQLFQRLVASVLDGSHDDKITSQARELVFLPFDTTEDAWFQDFLSHGEGRSLKRAKDMLLVRRIACDRFEELTKYKANNEWAAVLEGIKSGVEGHLE